MTRRKVLIHIVTWNSEDTIRRCIECAMAQSGFTLGDNLSIRVTDNASSDSTLEKVCSFGDVRGLEIVRNERNLGFCGGHNQGASACMRGGFDALLILNPDVGLLPTTLSAMCGALASDKRWGIVTPKLLRASGDLSAASSGILDAAGMVLTSSLRHFDRGSGEVDSGCYNSQEAVFGATGACVLISRETIEDVAIPDTISDEAVWRIFPELTANSTERIKLFDEAFFAYREDADLSWRAHRRGWKCIYEPAAVATHVRVVTPERRATLPARLNAFSVRNRFLLQLNNWDLSCGWRTLLSGIVLRNLVVLLGVIVKERTSLGALKEAAILAKRARAIYRVTRT